MNEIAVISGKGGTGKSTLVLSILPYLDKTVIADCDVDAPDLKVILNSNYSTKKSFIGFKRPIIDDSKCTKCGLCYHKCNFDAITPDIKIKSGSCEGCMVCEYVCPNDAITMHDYVIGDIYTRETDFGPMVDARLIPGEESSGKLVTEVRKTSQHIAYQTNASTILIDGSPGLACNVISTITGTKKALIVTEPTLSGLHDLKRVLELSEMFSVKADVIINKYDLNDTQATHIEDYCNLNDINVILKIPFDKNIVKSITNLKIPSLDNNPFFDSCEWLEFIDYIQKS